MAGHIKHSNDKVRNRLRRKTSIRLRITGTAERPRLSVFRSARYVYAQAIDDVSGRVVASASELDETVKAAVAGKPKKERARAVGALAVFSPALTWTGRASWTAGGCTALLMATYRIARRVGRAAGRHGAIAAGGKMQRGGGRVQHGIPENGHRSPPRRSPPAEPRRPPSSGPRPVNGRD